MGTFDSQRDKSLLNTQHTGATNNLSSHVEVMGFLSSIWLRAEAESNVKLVDRIHHAIIDPR